MRPVNKLRQNRISAIIVACIFLGGLAYFSYNLWFAEKDIATPSVDDDFVINEKIIDDGKLCYIFNNGYD